MGRKDIIAVIILEGDDAVSLLVVAGTAVIVVVIIVIMIVRRRCCASRCCRCRHQQWTCFGMMNNIIIVIVFVIIMMVFVVQFGNDSQVGSGFLHHSYVVKAKKNTSKILFSVRCTATTIKLQRNVVASLVLFVCHCRLYWILFTLTVCSFPLSPSL